ncbi:uncharacterized protein LOC117641381 [Thrips palmi]|uniref:Uncharacterized protein LOC117641381 n=1 Tax=Thrips palmi TaxID=161013 RepID=A0A6P8YDP5_THRPL|nr:uncharacterized protein LOC117641381 [Thrips palmi]
MSRAGAALAVAKAVSEAVSKAAAALVLSAVLLSVVGPVAAGRSSDKSKGCSFPAEWEGQWFQLGQQGVIINGSAMHGKGHCVESDGDKYIMMDKNDAGKQSCYGCMIIYQRHMDVLQYKEAWPCKDYGDQNIEQLCGDVHSDNPLHSMFRKQPKDGPVRCPFAHPPYTFSYNKGTGDCQSPVSRVDSCMDSSRLLIRNAACADVAGTQDLVEELECLATWKDGPYQYMVGKLSRPELGGVFQSDEESYRCFVYENVNNTTQIAVSPDASCTGIPSPSDGSKVMKLTRADLSHTRCKFPPWVVQHRHWYSLDKARLYNFTHTNSSFRHEVREDPNLTTMMASMALMSHGAQAPPTYSTGALAAGLQGDRHKRNELVGVCHSVQEAVAPSRDAAQAQPASGSGSGHDRKMARFVVHVTSGCESGYICMQFYERDNHVIEVQQSYKYAAVPDEACSADFFDTKTLPYVTLITAHPHTRKCPHVGRYIVDGQISQQRRKRKAIESNIAVTDPDTSHLDNFADCAENSFQSLAVGCQSHSNDIMEFHSTCSNMATSYSCHGTWEENGTSYLIASTSKSSGAKRFCFIYTREMLPIADGYNRLDGKHGPMAAARRSSILRLSTVAESCQRDIVPGHNGAWAFNLTVEGQCDNYGVDGTDGATTAQLSGILITAALIAIASLSALR